MNFDEEEFIKKLIIDNGRLYYKKTDGTLVDVEVTDKEKISPELQWKINEHGKICDFLKNLYKTKNADYGDSMHPLYEKYGLTAFLVLFGTKINRVETLMTKDSHTYESLEDSLLDLANYALIAVTELRAEKTKEITQADPEIKFSSSVSPVGINTDYLNKTDNK